MYINKAIRNIMKAKKISLGTMAEILWKDELTQPGVKNQGGNKRTGNAVSSRLNNQNMSFNTAVEMLTELGYEIVIQEKKPGNRRADQIVIDQNDFVNLDILLSDENPPVNELPTKQKTSENRIKLR